MYNNYSKLQSAGINKDVKCKSLIDYFNELKELKHEGVLLYRGHSNYDYDLIPSIGRLSNGHHIYTLEDEKQMFIEFKKNYSLFTDNRPTTDIDILFLAQHFGVPTRLLDWSYNPLIALYFACQGDDKVNGCVYAIIVPKEESMIKEGHWYDFRIFDKDSYQHDYEYIIPDYNNRRFLNQKGMFVLYKDPFSPIEKSALAPVFIIKNKKQILEELYSIGITDSMVLPTLDNLGKEIANKYKRI